MARFDVDLTGKVALVSGASRGIGEEIATAFAHHGAEVILTSRKIEGLQSVEKKINDSGGKAVSIACHNGKLEEIEALFAEIRERYGRLDILVENMGRVNFGPALMDRKGALHSSLILSVLAAGLFSTFTLQLMNLSNSLLFRLLLGMQADGLYRLSDDQAGEILKHFPDRLRNDVVLRIATLDGVQPSALKELNDSLTRMLSGSSTVKKAAMGGVHHAAEILNFIGSAHETAVIDNVREYDPELAQKILDEMFVFENLLDIDDRGIQTVLREVQSDSLIVALKGAAPELREKIFKNMSSRAAEMLREDLESRGPVRLSEVEAEQKEILKIVRRLAEEGQIMMASKGGDDGFV